MTTASKHPMLTKVPAIIAIFWVIKILSTTVGETFADFLDSTLGLGLGNTALAMTGILLVLLAVQFAVREYIPVVYWTTIVAISTIGTLITDNLHDGLGIENWQSILIFGAALTVTLLLWYKREGTLEMKSINTRTREAFYWLAILFTFALGTAGGDVFLDDLGLPLAVTFAGFTAALALVWLAYKRNWLSPVTSFWIAYVLTRPLGAALGDGLAQPTADTGLGLGPTLVSGVFLVAILGLVAYLTISKRDRLES